MGIPLGTLRADGRGLPCATSYGPLWDFANKPMNA